MMRKNSASTSGTGYQNPSQAINEEYLMEIFIRMRPILRDFEDEVAWVIDHEKNSISSIDNSTKQSNLLTASTNSNNNRCFNQNAQESLAMIKRRYADSYYSYSFDFGIVFY
jgi:hypothetical protein